MYSYYSLTAVANLEVIYISSVLLWSKNWLQIMLKVQSRKIELNVD
jgi:hypothetical protein